MKKILLPLLLILAVGVLAAVESEPSEIVGYFNLTAASNSWSPLSLPFDYTDLSVGNVLGDFLNDDAIYDIATSSSSVYYEGFGWFGDLVNLEYGKVYWINRIETNPTFNYYILGKVDPNPVTVTFSGYGWTPFALNEATNIPLSSLTFSEAVNGDEIYDIATSSSTVYYEGFGWFGDLENIEPTHGYWYNRVDAGYTWTYTPSRSNNNVKNQFNSKNVK